MKLWYGQPVPFLKEEESFSTILEKNIKDMVGDGTKVDINWLNDGYSDPTYIWTEMYNAVEGVKRYYEAWKTGYDGVIIGCSHDPGLVEARSVVDIPVVGVLESALLIASCLGHRFSVIALHQPAKAVLTDRIRRYGLADKLASIGSLNMGPLESAEKHSEPATMVDLFRKQAVKAISEDGAEVIIPGCTIVSTLITSQKVFAINEVPIIDPVFAGIKMAEVMVDLKKTYGIGVCRASIYAAAAGWEKELPIQF